MHTEHTCMFKSQTKNERKQKKIYAFLVTLITQHASFFFFQKDTIRVTPPPAPPPMFRVLNSYFRYAENGIFRC